MNLTFDLCFRAGITVLLSLTVFMLLVAEIMPATSDSVPLIGETVGSVTLLPLRRAVEREQGRTGQTTSLQSKDPTTGSRTASVGVCACVRQSAGFPPFGSSFSDMIPTDCFCFPAQYFATTMVIVGLSVIATVLVLQYHHHDPDGGHMPRWVSTSSCCFLLRLM